MEDILTIDRIAVFGPAKNRPILFSALAWADVLLTLDERDFGALIETTFLRKLYITPPQAYFWQSSRPPPTARRGVGA